jgi:hypothetical protein
VTSVSLRPAGVPSYGYLRAMTRAQTVFVVALSVVALLIGAFAVYVASSTMWADRWYGRRPRRR